MKHAALVLLSVSLLAAPLAHARQAGETVPGPRPPYNTLAPPTAVDHMVVLEQTETGPPRKETVVVTRTGPWERRDTARSHALISQYSDFDRAISLTTSTHANGGEMLSAYQHTSSSQGPFIRERTGETQTWAGEPCDVWSWRVAAANPPARNLSCVTHDGIELWAGYLGYSGAVGERFHATQVIRRKVLPDEVRIPHFLLDWKRWSQGAGAGDITRGDQVRLRGDVEDIYFSVDDITIDRRGDWTLQRARRGTAHSLETGVPRPSLSISVIHPRAWLQFSDNDHGRSVSLGRNMTQDRIGGGPVPIEPRREGIYAGRTCLWYDMTPGMQDSSTSECHDENGAVLARGGTGWGGNVTQSVQATHYSPEPASAAAMTPPAETLSWLID